LTDFNDRASALKSGKSAAGVLFEHANFEGRSIPFGPSSTIPCFADFKSQESKLNDLTSSIRFGADKCVIVNYRTTTEQYADFSANQFFCSTTAKANVNLPRNLEHLRVIMYRLNVSVTLFEGENFSGKSWTLSNREDFDVKKVPFYTIKSFKYSG